VAAVIQRESGRPHATQVADPDHRADGFVQGDPPADPILEPVDHELHESHIGVDGLRGLPPAQRPREPGIVLVGEGRSARWGAGPQRKGHVVEGQDRLDPSVHHLGYRLVVVAERGLVEGRVLQVLEVGAVRLDA
jgi:hypothetical protein